MQLTKNVNQPFHLRLVGVAADGSIVPAQTGTSLAFNKSSNTMTGTADSDNQGEVLTDSAAETATLTPVVVGATIPLEDDSQSITVTVVAVSNPAVAHRIIEAE